MRVLIGVDPHKHSHTAAVLNQRGELLAQQRFPASREGHRALRRFAKRWPQRRWAIEGAAGVGRVLAQQLVTNGEQVIDVPAKLAARVRELSTGHGRKHDTGDAVSIALAAQGSQRLHQVDVEDQATVLRLLSDRRDDLVATRTQTLHRLHGCWPSSCPQAPTAI
jgi:transposase